MKSFVSLITNNGNIIALVMFTKMSVFFLKGHNINVDLLDIETKLKLFCKGVFKVYVT